MVREGSGSIYQNRFRKKSRGTLAVRQHFLSVFTPEEATIRARLVIKGEEADWLIHTMVRFKAGTQRALEIAKQGKAKFIKLVRASMSVISNNRYARGSAKPVQGITKSIKALQRLGEEITLNDVELKDWCMIQSIGAKTILVKKVIGT